MSFTKGFAKKLGVLEYLGTWNAYSNTPTLSSGAGSKGGYYVVATSGSTNLDGETDWKPKDWAIFNGTAWEKIDNSESVTSVAGKTGAITLNISDLSNVSISDVQANQILSYNGSSWINKTMAESSVNIAGKTAIAFARIAYSSNNVSTTSYSELVASLSAAVSEVEIYDSSGKTLVLATGSAGSEVNKIYIMPGGNQKIPLTLASGTRVAVKAVSEAATYGELVVNFYG